MTEATPLQPGFMVVHGNHPEALRDLMLAWLARHPLAPLEDEAVLVQSNGVAQWLRLALARPAAAGGIGIAAALAMQLPARFVWQAYRAVLGDAAVPVESPFDKPLLSWRLMRLLPALLAEPAFAPLAHFLDDDADLRKRHQLAERLADLFDQYQVYRADWLADWAAGEDVLATSRRGRLALPEGAQWQPRLWRALLEDVGSAGAGGSRAAVHARFLSAAGVDGGAGRAAADAGVAPGSATAGSIVTPAVEAVGASTRPAGLPRRIVVFGISSLPQQSLEVLAALARWCQVLMCVHNPCEHDWSHIVADTDLLRAERRRQRRRDGRERPIDGDALHMHAQPLLAAWGKQGRDFIRLLDLHDDRQSYAGRFAALGQRVDCFDANPGDTLLRQLQDDIRELRPLAESRAHWPAVAGQDRSIRFHVTHGPQREVEVLHDELLAAFAADPGLRPRDVIVMVPDIAVYAPHVQAVFGLLTPEDPRHVPFSLADQGQRHHDPLLGALEKLLGLPQSRVAVSDVLDLLEVPALRRRFGIDDADLPLLHRWVAAANVRWGLHAGHRERLELPAGTASNAWDFGLQRMLLGYAAGAGDAWQGIEPLDEIGGLDAALLGPLIRLLATLESHWRTLATPAEPAEWGRRLGALLADCFEADDGADGYTLLRLAGELQSWLDACAAAGLEEPLPLAVVREHWLARLDDHGLQQPFFAGAVTFATLMPMRAIPFRVVALLGMNDGDYPRSRVPADFDLMADDYRPGDRSRREDDRYLFLEALLSARERLHVSWVGRSILDHSERPPSVLVAQLRDHLAAGWRRAGDDGPAAEAGARLLAALTVEHRLQPFHPDYFSSGGDPRLFSHAREWRPAAPAPAPVETTAADGPAALAPWAWEGPLTLALLGACMKDPVREFFRARLGVHFGDRDDPVGEDHEPFALDGLARWRLQEELIRGQLAALDTGRPREDALQRGLERMARRGDLPAGAFAGLVQQELAEPMARLFDTHAQALAEWPEALPDDLLDHLPEGAAEPLRLTDWLGGLRRGDAGARGRLVLTANALLQPDRHYRVDQLMPHWVAHLAGHLDGAGFDTLVIGKNGSVRLPALAAADARAHWRGVLALWTRHWTGPPPIALGAADAWLRAGGTTAGAAALRSGAVDGVDDAGRHAGGEVDGAHRDAVRPGVAWTKAREAYEGSSGPRGGQSGERERRPWLTRAFPDFEALWSGGEFAVLTEQVLRPLRAAIGSDKAAGDDRGGEA